MMFKRLSFLLIDDTDHGLLEDTRASRQAPEVRIPLEMK
jgi:hypothetical protein